MFPAVIPQLEGVKTAEVLSSVGIIIPTLNACPYLSALLPALSRQGVDRDRILVIDSSSDDDTVKSIRTFGARVNTIPRGEFNHGRTRRQATPLIPNAEILVFMTQDAIPASDDAIVRLVAAFSDPNVGVAYGRQLPRPAARAIECHARLVNYPEHSEVRRLEDRARLGARTPFCSNSFAAYRRSALEVVGGFPSDALFAEDQIVAARMLCSGWTLAYQADARVYHSHAYTIGQEFRRYFDVGVFHARNPWLEESFGRAEGEGLKFVLSELRFLSRHEPLSIPSALVRTAAKYIAYRLGENESRLSTTLKAKLSMQPSYWRGPVEGKNIA